jgi:hypothetical protein
MQFLRDGCFYGIEEALIALLEEPEACNDLFYGNYRL